MAKVTVLIPVYKQLEKFIANLRANVPLLQDCDYVIVNDDPSVSIKSAVFEVFNELNIVGSRYTILENSKNVGFAKSVNVGVDEVKTPYLMLLNSDVTLQDTTWLNAFTKLQADDNIFAIGFAQIEKNGNIVGRNSLYFKSGLFHHKGLEAYDADKSKQFLDTAWVECGAGIFVTKYFKELGGLDEEFSPFYWEDVDLSYRASLRGWKVLFYNGCRVLHHHETSINAAYHKSHVLDIAYRNQEYFTQKHAKGKQKGQFMLHKVKHNIKKSFGSKN